MDIIQTLDFADGPCPRDCRIHLGAFQILKVIGRCNADRHAGERRDHRQLPTLAILELIDNNDWECSDNPVRDGRLVQQIASERTDLLVVLLGQYQWPPSLSQRPPAPHDTPCKAVGGAAAVPPL